MRTIKSELLNSVMNTCQGEAVYQFTEVEDENGRWNDHWSFSAGEMVRHEGKEHHVFFVL